MPLLCFASVESGAPLASLRAPPCPALTPSLPAVCGIFGYYNHRVPRSRREILECLLTGLRRLEYRGYDSAGISVDGQPAGCGADGGAERGGDGRPGGPRALRCRCLLV